MNDREKYLKQKEILDIPVWNEAIDQAAKIAERSETNITKLIAEDIRSLKK